MKKRVISWLLCLALCLSMLPMAALAEDVQAPEGPAPSMNEPQPEPRAKENETPAPEPEKKVQSELMTAEKLLMPLSDETPAYTVGDILAERNGVEIGDKGIIGEEIRIRVIISGLDDDVQEFGTLLKSISISIDDTPYTVSGGRDGTGPRYVYCDFKPTEETHRVTFSISGTDIAKTRELTFAKCPHPGIKSGNTCSQCGATLVAEINSATYYETLTEALDAAQTEENSGCTVKLLADCILRTYELQKGTFTLDFNGHTLTQTNSFAVDGTANLTVKNDRSKTDENNGRFYLKSKTATLSVTIGSKYDGLMSYSGVGYILGPDMGYKVNGKWATLSQLLNTLISKVTVEKAPFSTSDITVTPEDTYVNRKVTLAVTLDCLADGRDATCEYFVETSTSYGTTNSEQLKSPTLDAKTFTTDYTPKVPECTICARITSDDFYVIKKLEKTFKTCTHDQVNQDTGYCDRCDSQMAASVSPSALVGQRTYYETFDLAMNAAWDMLKTSDCWFTMFQDAQVGTINYEYASGGNTLHMELNGQTLSGGVVFRVPADKWKLSLESSGTVIGDTSNATGVRGVIEVAPGGSLNIHGGTIKIQNKGAETKGAYAPSIMVEGYSGTELVRGVADISGDAESDFGSLWVNCGKVTANGGTYDHARVTYGGELKVSNGKFQGDVTVDDHASLVVGSTSAYFDGMLTFKSDGMGRLSLGNYKHIKTENATLGKLNNNYAYVFMNGGVYVPDARNKSELIADDGKYITIESHTHDYDDTGKCKICNEEAEAYLLVNGQRSYGYFDKMLDLAEEKDGSCVYLLKDVTIIRDTEVKEGNFSIAGGRFKVTCSGSSALKFSGGTVSIGDGTFGRLKVTGDGKLTLNGGKYYAIDVTDSSVYTNYGLLLPDYYAFKASTTWEAKGNITAASFASDTAKEVKILPLRSVTISADGETTVPYGTSVKFTATVESNSSSGTTYKWFCDGVEIPDETTNELTVAKDIGSYEYRCDVTRDGYTLSSNPVQLTVQRIGLSGAALSATIARRAYDGTTSAKIEDGSSLTLGNLTVPASAYTLSAVFADKNAGKNKNVTVTVKLTNTNYCFGYKSDGTLILEKTFETTGTITQNITPIVKDKTIEVYSGIAHTYTVDLDACLSNLQDLGFEGYQITEKDIVVSKLIDANQVVLEGHSLKIPVNAVVTAPGTVAAKFTIAVACKNYSNVTILVRVETKDRSTVTATATPSKSKLTYGEKLDTIALSGTTDPMIPGTFAWQTPDAILDAGRHADLVWKFIPADYTYAEASGTAAITVKQARLTDPAPVTLTIYNGWAGTYEAALPELPALAEGLYFGKNTAYGEPDVSAGGYYSSGAELKTVNGKQGVSIPILKNETTKEGQVGTITVQYTSQNYEPVTLAINLVAKNRTAPTFILTADHDTLSGGGKVTLTLARGNLPDGAVVTVSGTDEAGNAVTLTDNGDGTYSATLPNKTQTYTFIAVYDESQTIAPKTDIATVKVQQRSSGGEPAKPSFPVKISNSGDGVAKVDKSYASAGNKVTITVTPGRNATVQRITVTDEDGERLKLTENRDGTYSFTMPSGTANVYVRFSGSGLPFADVPSGSWYYDDVAYVYDTGLMTGLTATAFGPNLSTTRGMIVTILWRMENEPAAKHGCPFADVRRGSYYEQAIAWASENGIVTGFDASTFAPDRAITREQLAAILFRFAAYRGMDAVTLRENLSSFQDQAAISAYAVSALNWAVGEGLMQGTGDKLEPTGSATRAQVAAMLRRFIQRNF